MSDGVTTADGSAPFRTPPPPTNPDCEPDKPKPAVTFESKVPGTPIARACAGGVAVDGAHSFTMTGIAKFPDGSIAPNVPFKLSFENNRGHNYSSDDSSLWPVPNWTTDKIRKAKFVTTDASGQQTLVEEMNVTSDSAGQFSVTVLSSDIVSTDITVQVHWTDDDGKDQVVGSQACQFAPVQAEWEYGTISGATIKWKDPAALLTDDETMIAARVLLKWQPDVTKKPLAPVNGHLLAANFGKLTQNPDMASVPAPPTNPTTVYFADANGQPVDHLGKPVLDAKHQPVTDPAKFSWDPLGFLTTSSEDGTSAPIYLDAGPLINRCAGIQLKIKEQTQHQ